MMSPETNTSIQVNFPCVHGLARGQLVTINCFRALELKSAVKVVTGIDEEIAGRIIGASRYAERDGRAGMGVMVLFSNPLFSGESYGLALAVADKLARYAPTRQWKAIYATGFIPPEGCGRVEKIGSFIEKLKLIEEDAKAGSLFLFPQSNLELGVQGIEEQLHLLRHKGVTCTPVASIEELAGKLWISEASDQTKLLYKKMQLSLWNKFAKTMSWQRAVWFCLATIICFITYLMLFANQEEQSLLGGEKTVNDSGYISLAKEENNEIPHQETVQGAGIYGSDTNPSSLPDPEPSIMARQEAPRHKERALESADTDSSLY